VLFDGQFVAFDLKFQFGHAESLAQEGTTLFHIRGGVFRWAWEVAERKIMKSRPT